MLPLVQMLPLELMSVLHNNFGFQDIFLSDTMLELTLVELVLRLTLVELEWELTLVKLA